MRYRIVRAIILGDAMGWAKIGTLCSLKAIAVACFLTPAATVLPTTPALAQFGIFLGGFGGHYRGRRYGRRHARHSSRRGRGNDSQAGEVSAAPTTGSPGVVSGSPSGPPPSGPSGTGGKKIRGTSD